MRVLCPECGEKSRIHKSNRLDPKFTDLYCSCSDPECGHSFVMNLSYSHTLSPSAKTTSQMAFTLAQALPPEQRKQLHQTLGNQLSMM